MRIISLFITLVFLSACNGGNGNSVNPFNREPTYEEKKMSIEEEEKNNPARFLTASGTYRNTYSGNKMRVSGQIASTATVANFKDVVIRFTYYSATDTQLGSDQYVLYEFVNAGQLVKFEWKLDVPSACSKLGMDVISATPY
jgi:hypothetical protein